MILSFENKIKELISRKSLDSIPISNGKLEEFLSDLLIEQAREEFDSRKLSDDSYDLFSSENVGEFPQAFAYAIRVGEFSDEEIRKVFLKPHEGSFIIRYYDGNCLSNLREDIMKRYDLKNDSSDALEDTGWNLNNFEDQTHF